MGSLSYLCWQTLLLCKLYWWLFVNLFSCVYQMFLNFHELVERKFDCKLSPCKMIGMVNMRNSMTFPNKWALATYVWHDQRCTSGTWRASGRRRFFLLFCHGLTELRTHLLILYSTHFVPKSLASQQWVWICTRNKFMCSCTVGYMNTLCKFLNDSTVRQDVAWLVRFHLISWGGEATVGIATYVIDGY
jgi:hypothetical protein